MRITKDLLFSKFKEKYTDDQITNIYDHPELVGFYNQAFEGDDFVDDLNFYQTHLVGCRVIEVGSGSGRVLGDLLAQGIDAYGIEPSSEMVKSASELVQSRTIKAGVDSLKQVIDEIGEVDAIIIPATSISLFSDEVLQSFFREVGRSKVEAIYFDCLSPIFFGREDGQLHVNRLDDKVYWAVNFIRGNQVIYNLATSDCIGVSQKYLHTQERLMQLAQASGYVLKIVASQGKDYHMYEARR